MEAEETISSIRGFLHPHLPKSLHLPYGVPSLPCQPLHVEKPQGPPPSSLPSCPFIPEVHMTERCHQDSTSNEASSAPKDGGRSAPSALPKGKKALQGTAETEVPAKHRDKKSNRQDAPKETFKRFAPLAMEAEETLSSIWGRLLHPQLPKVLCLPYGVPSLPLKTPIRLQIPLPFPAEKPKVLCLPRNLPTPSPSCPSTNPYL
ncbi:hypothetical protein PoB_005424100 [Plakobranchus ocellatus]|uniref:Uncharacterized protein n=1 Tax=Plakobranchus ocellatus TaxID=259542 RepID=A0AAV4C8S4_9GAST|nr:hypothetical protein PoB_005424100 [Plakobranchus ocellatus]